MSYSVNISNNNNKLPNYNECICNSCSGVIGDTCCDRSDNLIIPNLEQCHCLESLFTNNNNNISNKNTGLTTAAIPTVAAPAADDTLSSNNNCAIKLIKWKFNNIYRQLNKHIVYKNYLFTKKKSVYKYLKEFKRKLEVRMLIDNQEVKIGNNFWNSYLLDVSSGEVKPIKKLIYQTSPLKQYESINDNENNQNLIKDFWYIYKIDTNYFYNWIYKLRLYLSTTILQRIVKEIDKVNTELKKVGYLNISIGTTGLHTLENLTNINDTNQRIPSLTILLSFLSLSPYQNYIVQRIRELAKSNCLWQYTWNSSGDIYQSDGGARTCKSHLPTDAKLLMHLFCTYLDMNLPLDCSTNQKPFTNKYLIKNLKGIDARNCIKIAIVDSPNDTSNTHYKLMVNSTILDLPAGRNNLFYAILLFLKYLHSNENGMLGQISLGKPGLNMLWIISD